MTRPRTTVDPGPRRDSGRIAEEIEADRAAFDLALARLRARLTQPLTRARAKGTGGATGGAFAARAGAVLADPTLQAVARPLALAALGAGISWLTRRGGRAARPQEDPAWLVEAAEARARAEDLADEIRAAGAEGLLSPSEAERNLAELRAAREADQRRIMLRGLEGLAPEERDAALSLREARAVQRFGQARRRGADRGDGLNPALTGILAAGGAAALAWWLRRAGAGAEAAASEDEPPPSAPSREDAALAELRAVLDQAIAKLETIVPDED
ncbi:hypothetical protein [Pseudogemmobacter sonorensis]|uniref:hypothetical protein n=1 Tax=Pseudogemmobacter sonorensis TaxID=2989681 RepID=UPI00368D00FB